MSGERFYILFPSYTEGMKLESILRKNNIKYTIVPTPRQLSVSCGISIMYNEEDGHKIIKLIDENDVNILGMKSLVFLNKNFYL
jgi:ribosomal protein L7Ae-like RNA K-turn-binding protein